MPSYDMACTPCGERFEVFRQGFLRDEDRRCPNCESVDVQQRFTGFVTARPRGAGPAATGGCCGGSCGCGSG